MNDDRILLRPDVFEPVLVGGMNRELERVVGLEDLVVRREMGHRHALARELPGDLRGGVAVLDRLETNALGRPPRAC